MLVALISINVLIFSFISLLHFYWAFGGRWASDQVIPDHLYEATWQADPKVIISTLIVALGLATFGLVMLSNLYPELLPIPAQYIEYATWGIGGIFLLRAIGEFHYVGFFKRVKDTRFAAADSRIFSPLCLLIASAAFGIAFLG